LRLPELALLAGLILSFLAAVHLAIQGSTILPGFANLFYYNPYLGFFLQMLPYLFALVVRVIGSSEAMRKCIGAPVALGTPYICGERGL